MDKIIDPFISVQPSEPSTYAQENLSSTGIGQSLFGDFSFGDQAVSSVLVDGKNGRIVFYNNGIPSILIGNPA